MYLLPSLNNSECGRWTCSPHKQTNATRLEVQPLLDRATELDRILFSRDKDLLKIAAERQHSNPSFSGLVYAHQLRVSVGRCVEDLELIAKTTNPEEWIGKVTFLPL